MHAAQSSPVVTPKWPVAGIFCNHKNLGQSTYAYCCIEQYNLWQAVQSIITNSWLFGSRSVLVVLLYLRRWSFLVAVTRNLWRQVYQFLRVGSELNSGCGLAYTVHFRHRLQGRVQYWFCKTIWAKNSLYPEYWHRSSIFQHVSSSVASSIAMAAVFSSFHSQWYRASSCQPMAHLHLMARMSVVPSTLFCPP